MAESDSAGAIPLTAPEGDLRDLSDPEVRTVIAQRARTAARLSIVRMRRSGKLGY